MPSCWNNERNEDKRRVTIRVPATTANLVPAFYGGPAQLCITRNGRVKTKLKEKLPQICKEKWQILPLHVECQGAYILKEE